MPAACTLASPSSACFTRCASSLLGSGFGASGALASAAGLGASACGAGAGAAGVAAGLAGGGSSLHAARARSRALTSKRVMAIPLLVAGKQLFDRSCVEAVLVVAHLVADHNLALLGEDRIDFLAAQ